MSAYNSYLHIRALKTRVISFLKHYKIVIFHTESTIYTNIFNHCENVFIIQETYFICICIKKDHKTKWIKRCVKITENTVQSKAGTRYQISLETPTCLGDCWGGRYTYPAALKSKMNLWSSLYCHAILLTFYVFRDCHKNKRCP